MASRPWEPGLTFHCHSLVTNEQHRSPGGSNGWLQGCGFSDSELVPEFRSTELELRALLINVTVQTDGADFTSVCANYQVF